MERYVKEKGTEEKEMVQVKKLIQKLSEDVNLKLNSVNESVKVQMEQLREEWKREKKMREEERRKDKEEWMDEYKKLEKRLGSLEWEREKKNRERRRNNIVVREVDGWGTEKIEQEVMELLKEKLKLEVQVEKAFKIKLGGKAHMAEIRNWEQKKEIMEREVAQRSIHR